MSVTAPNAQSKKATPAPEASPRVYKLNTAHRCDRCGAQAYVHVVLNNDKGELYFCKHHHNKYELALLPISDPNKTNDESDRLRDVNRLVGTENN